MLKKDREQVAALLSLTRWKEHVTYVVPLTILGAILAIKSSTGYLDIRLVYVTLANIGAVAYAFMLNDIEDADDDIHDPHKAKRNPVSAKRISKTAAYTACRIVALSTLLLYYLAGGLVLWIGIFTLLISHLYSWKTIRLKAWPVVDILSHSLMLSALLMIAGFYTYESSPGAVWYVICAATLFSVYGQLYNQVRDFAVDKKAGLKNTAILLGKQRTQMLLYVSIVLALASLAYAIFKGVFPLWLALPLLGGFLIGRRFHATTDMSGTAVVDITGSAQVQSVIMLNVTTFVWLLEVLIR